MMNIETNKCYLSSFYIEYKLWLFLLNWIFIDNRKGGARWNIPHCTPLAKLDYVLHFALLFYSKSALVI